MLYTPAEVFMVPDRNDPTPQVAPVPVFVPKGAERDPKAPQVRVRRALALLLDGPRGRYVNLDTAIPPGTRLRGFQLRQGRGNRQPLAQLHPARRLRAAPGRPGRLDGEPPAPDRVGPVPGRGPRRQHRGRRPVPDQPAVEAAGHAAGRDAAATLPGAPARLDPVRAAGRDLHDRAGARPEAGAGPPDRPRPQVGADLVAGPPLHGLPVGQRAHPAALGAAAQWRRRPGRWAVGQAVAPVLEPRLQDDLRGEQ